MKEYCCQIFISERILEIFYEDYFEAVEKCNNAETKAFVFKYPDMENPIYIPKAVK